MRWGVPLLVGLSMAGCVTDAGFHCETDEQCSSNLNGMCEPTGFCSFPDGECTSGRRYGDEAAGLSGLCTDETPGGADAAQNVSDGAASPDGAQSGADAGPDAPDANADQPDATPSWDAGPIIVDFTPSSLDQSLLTAATNRLALQDTDGEVTINTDNGQITRTSDMADLHPIGVGFQTIDQGNGLPDIGVFTMTELDIEDGVTVVVVGSNALAFAVGGDATVRGVIDLRGGAVDVDDPGAGGYAGGTSTSCDGAGAGGGSAGAGVDVGGGGGGHEGVGGAGGARGASPGGAGGDAAGQISLVPLAGGGGGGCGYGSSMRGDGGGGGGAIQISARGTIRIGATGAINAGGGGGGGGRADGGGGGGGAGGAVLLEGGRVVINGVVSVNGGGGGAGANAGTEGAAGDRGKASSTPASGGAASGEGTTGGNGAAGAAANGEAGTTASPPATDNAGGGGGAGGRIRLRSNDIAHPGTTSPSGGLSQAAL